MINVNEWLDEILEQTGQPRYQRILWLLEANGGASVRQWGMLSFKDGKQFGLEMTEALELMQYVAFMDGLEAADVRVAEALKLRGANVSG